MNTNTHTSLIVLALIIGLVGGFAGASAFQKDTASVSTNTMHQMPDGRMMHNEMNNMMSGLSGKKGDEFDKAFLTEMIVHHEGAVDMAEAALKDAKHEEIKTLANEIISAQTTEIAQMKDWFKSWYGREQ